MNAGWKGTILGAMTTLIVCLLGVVSVRSQAGPAQPQMAEAVFKNVQVLKGIPVDEFMDTMGITIEKSNTYNPYVIMPVPQTVENAAAQ